MPFTGSLDTIQANIITGNTTCVALVQHYLKNIEKHKQLNAFVEVFEDEALDLAAKIDAKFANGRQGKLAGLVVGIKDLIVYDGHKASASSKILEGFESIYSATAIKKLLEEDAIIIGRQNCDEFGMGSSNENSAHGPVLNGLAPTRSAGGSSGGSAVAVQMDMCAVSLGSDTGGSVRQPAAFCGVIGLKPTYSRISRRGLIAYASSFDTIGVISKNISDNRRVLQVISGQDNLDSTSSSSKFESKARDRRHYKICYFDEVLNSGLGHKESTIFKGQLDKLKSCGHKVEPVSFPLQGYLVPAYYLLTMAEASSNLSRYDGVRYGHRASASKSYQELFSKSRSEGFGDEVKRRILLGTFVLSSGYYDAYIMKAQQARRLIKEATEQIFMEYDFIISPTTPTTAFELGKSRENPTEVYLEDIFTVHASLAGLPAISVPIKEKIDNLPLGIHVSANEFGESALYDVAEEIIELNAE